jgi:predicted house-cleaning noncanonical NTP pyrophosphatase (MazG superfamily)
MDSRGVRQQDVAFILHRYIPARAAAWSYYSVGDDHVVIDSLWGLPDGLQFLEHDSYQVDAGTGEELAADLPYKRHFLQEQADGAWSYVKVARQFGRDRTLSREALRHIAAETVAIARNVKEQAQIMWFCDIPEQLGLGRHLPWFRSKDYAQHTAAKRPPLPEWRVTNLGDLSNFAASGAQYILRVDPEVDLVRNDEQFLDQVIQVARQRSAPVSLVGSTLGHAYYKLRAAGVMVLSGGPSHRRVRKRRVFGKLVRDAMPQNIAARGEIVSIGRLSKAETTTALIGKLFEEGIELSLAASPSGRLEELSDLLEVVRGLNALAGTTWQELDAAAQLKREKRGGFENQTVLIETARSRGSASRGSSQEISEPQVSLRDVGIVHVREGYASIPFTRVLAARELEVELPWGGGTAVLSVAFVGTGIEVRLRDRLPEQVSGEEQPPLPF